MSGGSSPDYKALFFKAEEERKLAEERQRQAEERQRQAEEGESQERERNRPTTFPEFIRHCHDLLWMPLRAQTSSRSTTGRIPAPMENTVPYDCAHPQNMLPYNVKSMRHFAATYNLPGRMPRGDLRP
jgi:hypothetical protein